MDDHLPAAEIIHDVASPSGDRWTEALSLTRRDGRWSQHLYSVLGRRRGRRVEVHVVQSYDPAQETGPKGYLDDDEVVWRIEAVCFPLDDPPAAPFATVGDTPVAEGRYCFDLTMDDLVWVIGEPSTGAPLLAHAYLRACLAPRAPDAQLRLTVRHDASDDPAASAGWAETLDDEASPTGDLRRWRRRIGDDLIELHLRFTGDASVLNTLPDRLLNSFWIIS